MLPEAGALASRMAWAPRMKLSQPQVLGLTGPLEQGRGGGGFAALGAPAGASPELGQNKRVPTGGNLALLEKTQPGMKRTRVS